ncbi:hypothetical protein GCM10010275_03440 [Streptomyces litmocidini]|uniref:hypothetical protein n=1 Tax=Streptomyces litmocidini TaxID=67318 RepID=UPI00167C9C5B|nr:hypothetical protein [Streptomyces litmocidini]GGU72262.1 hypothetical protein GCM10010275_03440 [Streptomyces litmocidini]
MTVDPNEPDTFIEEEVVVLDEETPEADAAEQHAELQQREDELPAHVERDSANEADASEQARVVALDEDDYR